MIGLGAAGCGACVGYVLGLITKKYTSPRANELVKALAESQEYHNTVVGRLKGQIRQFEYPVELSKIDKNSGDLVQTVINAMGGISKMPRWVQPFVPAIQSYIKENPGQVEALVQKFTARAGAGRRELEEESL